MTTLVLATRNAHKIQEIRALLPARFALRSLDNFPAAPPVVEDAGTFAGNATKKAVTLARWLAIFHTPVAAPRKSAAEQSSTLRKVSGALTRRRYSFMESEEWFVLADDSGLEVDALDGAPGVHSARFAALDRAAGEAANSPDVANNAKLLRRLADVPEARRTARFRCVLALTPVLPPQPETASPACYAEEGELRTRLFEGACEGRLAFAPSGRGGFGYDPLFVPEGFSATFAELGEAEKNKISHRARALGKLREFFG